MKRFAVILSHNRPELLRQTVEAIGPQVDMVIVIDNASDPPVRYQDLAAADRNVSLFSVPDQPPNLAALWQFGIDRAANMRELSSDGERDEPWYIAFLCDDAPPPDRWFLAVTDAMEATGAVVGCSSPWPHPGPGVNVVKTAPDGDIMGRMPGWAFVLDATSKVRPDQSMHFWWLDTDLDLQARAAGGMVMTGGHPVPNLRPGEFTATKPWAAERIGLDTIAFEKRWGPRPW